ncbi:MAG: oxidoreductase [Patescibacteria group bacterium]|nr:oxidoreductase [Patescibacteria group bacterium]
MNIVDLLLDRVTMYRLMLYYLLALLGAAMLLGAVGYAAYNPVAVTLSAGYLTLVCWAANKAFAYILKVPVNPESSLITALILALIITPPTHLQGYIFLTAAAGLAIASKYLLTIRNHNIFNPAAIAVALTSLGAGESASWWVGSAVLLPFVIVGGVLVARKIRRGQLVASFLVVSLVMVAVIAAMSGGNVAVTLQKMLLNSSLFFFSFVMLTEPLTAPTTLVKQRWYGALAGLLFPPQIHILSLYSTPELVLVVSNLASYLMERKSRLVLRLSNIQKTGPNLADFIFTPSHKPAYLPGQYMEWTLPHAKPDDRGSRRYFTLASSPTEDNLRIGVKFYPKGSSYKQALLKLDAGTAVAAGQLGGDFVLPKDPAEKLAFIAGGIGVTPYRSMMKYLLDTRQERDITLLYAAHTSGELAYTDVFAAARQQFGANVVYVLDAPGTLSEAARQGPITTALIKAEIPDFRERVFFVSGPRPMVTATVAALKTIGVHASRIKTDFFPGYA